MIRYKIEERCISYLLLPIILPPINTSLLLPCTKSSGWSRSSHLYLCYVNRKGLSITYFYRVSNLVSSQSVAIRLLSYQYGILTNSILSRDKPIEDAKWFQYTPVYPPLPQI